MGNSITPISPRRLQPATPNTEYLDVDWDGVPLTLSRYVSSSHPNPHVFIHHHGSIHRTYPGDRSAPIYQRGVEHFRGAALYHRSLLSDFLGSEISREEAHEALDSMLDRWHDQVLSPEPYREPLGTGSAGIIGCATAEETEAVGQIFIDWYGRHIYVRYALDADGEYRIDTFWATSRWNIYLTFDNEERNLKALSDLELSATTLGKSLKSMIDADPLELELAFVDLEHLLQKVGKNFHTYREGKTLFLDGFKPALLGVDS